MKIQVWGEHGMLGRAVVAAAARRGHGVMPAGLHLEQATHHLINAPVVINCAGLVKQREEPASQMMLVNAVGPHRLAEACDAAGARLIHVSTDCVFSRPGPHDEYESADIDSDDDYARSKLAGEVYKPHLTIRTSFVGFGKWGLIARMQRPDETIYASNGLRWSGHTVDTIADLLVTLAERREITGLLHVPGEYQTRWKLCTALKERYHLPAAIVRSDGFVADRRLKSAHWGRWGLPELPPFDTQLETMERPS